METRNITIMLTDIKGFTSKTAGFSRAQTQEMLAKHRELVLPVIEKFGGRLVKTIGDAFLVAFNSPTDAVICGVEVQTVLRAHNEGKTPAEKIEIRIAINSGEVAIHDDGDIYGDAVNITSRLESIAEAGEVFFTESVYLSMNKTEVPSSEIGYRQFKGIPEKIKVFRVLREVPVGAQSQGVAAAGPATPLIAPAAAAAPAVAAPALQFQPAGIAPRAVSLFIDFLLFMIIASLLFGKGCGPTGIIKDKAGRKQAEMKISNININDKGIRIDGEQGKTITLNGKGATISDKSGTRKLKEADLGIGVSGEEDGDEGGDRRGAFPFKALFWVIYLTVFLKRKGATPGMMIMKLKLIDVETGLTPKKPFWRSVLGVVSALPAGLGYFWALWEKDQRTWHDLITGTRIVKS
ncbi:MAG: adenylate/guanylate cyclase domain-containing protein [Elusimicrobiota bacterium]|nr:adenylate/guanylate cyclase domain-containing protein [Elusimicrobiota bacterium]